jgi:hypothetical protein
MTLWTLTKDGVTSSTSNSSTDASDSSSSDDSTLTSSELEDVLSDLSDSTDLYIEYEEMTDTESADALAQIGEAVNNLIHSNSYITVYEDSDGEYYTTTITNESGESVAEDQDGGMSIFKTDGNSLMYYSSEVMYGENTNALDCLNYAYMAARDGFATFQKVVYDDATEDVYTIDILGYDNLEKMYSYKSEDFGADMIASIKDGFSSDETNDIDNPNFKYQYIMEDGELIAASCYLYFGDDGVTSSWSDCYIAWYFGSIYEVGEWSLDDSWYSYDFSTMDDDEGETVTEMVDTLRNNLLDMLDEYFEVSEDTLEDEEEAIEESTDSEDEDTDEESEDSSNDEEETDEDSEETEEDSEETEEDVDESNE